MRYALLFSFFSFAVVPNLNAQNLVPDPGFEIHTEDCEGYPALVHWFNPNTASPDLWCVEGCGNILTPQLIQTAEVPANPVEGSCYAGLYCALSPTSSNQTREYLTTELTTPLQSGVSYRVSFAIARSTFSNYAVDRIGIYFSFDAPSDPSFVVMDVEPQLETQGTILAPEMEWMLIEFEYVADGSEKYLTVGNFREPEEMMIENFGTSWNNWNVGYYLFDGFVVEPALNIGQFSDLIKLSFEPGSIIFSSPQEVEMRVMDLSGRVIVHRSLSTGTSRLDISRFVSGIYVVNVFNSSGAYTKKFWKE